MNLSAMTLFTFHYGSTYMTARERLSAVILTFTFHYGSTYIDGDYITFSWKLSFTFHYGSTYMHFSPSFLAKVSLNPSTAA